MCIDLVSQGVLENYNKRRIAVILLVVMIVLICHCRQQLQEQARLVLEENQILMEQVDVQQNKVKELCSSHMQEGTCNLCLNLDGVNCQICGLI